MSFDQKKFTNYVTENLIAAQDLAKANKNPEISNVHLAVSMLKDPKGFPYLVCQKAGVDVEVLKKKLDEQLKKIPTQDPLPDEIYFSASLSKILRLAQENATSQKDSRVAQDHVAEGLSCGSGSCAGCYV